MGPYSDRISAFIRKGRDTRAPSLSSMWEQSKKVAICKPGRVLTRNWICWLLALRLPSLQNCEKEMSVVSASLSWYFVLAAWPDQDNGLVIAMCFQLPEISAKTGSLLKDMKTESWPRACSFMPQTCSHDGGFDIAYSNKHQIKKNKIHHSKKIGLEHFRNSLEY